MATPYIEAYIPAILYHGLNTQKNITMAGSNNFDGSGSTGTFKTPTGVNTFGGPVVLTSATPLVGLTRPVTASGGATRTLTAANSGSMNLFDAATGVAYTLPSPVVGLWYEFVCTVAVTSNSYEIVTDGGSTFIGGSANILISNSATSKGFFADVAGSNVEFTMDGSTQGGLIGSYVRLTCVSATAWYAVAQLAGSGTIATPFTT